MTGRKPFRKVRWFATEAGQATVDVIYKRINTRTDIYRVLAEDFDVHGPWKDVPHDSMDVRTRVFVRRDMVRGTTLQLPRVHRRTAVYTMRSNFSTLRDASAHRY